MNILILILTARTYRINKMVIVSKVRFRGCGSSIHTTGDPTLSGEEYLDFPIEGNSIKNDWLNRLITVVTALTYPYTKNRHCFTGAIPMVTRLPVPGVSWGDEAARATDNEVRPQRNCGRARCV